MLDDVAPHLRGVNICGSRRSRDEPAGATIERIGEGEMDAFDVLAQLRRVGYEGHLGIQGYGVRGDPCRSLGHSLAALRETEARLDGHPHWAALRRSDPLPT